MIARPLISRQLVSVNKIGSMKLRSLAVHAISEKSRRKQSSVWWCWKRMLRSASGVPLNIGCIIAPVGAVKGRTILAVAWGDGVAGEWREGQNLLHFLLPGPKGGVVVVALPLVFSLLGSSSTRGA